MQLWRGDTVLNYLTFTSYVTYFQPTLYVTKRAVKDGRNDLFTFYISDNVKASSRWTRYACRQKEMMTKRQILHRYTTAKPIPLSYLTQRGQLTKSCMQLAVAVLLKECLCRVSVIQVMVI